MEKAVRQDACQLFIEQEIEAGLKVGKTPYSIGKELAAWVERLFEAKIPARTIEQKARRIENATNVASTITHRKDATIQENQEIKFEHGGPREGAGRPPKFAVVPDNTQFRTLGTGENEWYTPIEYTGAAREVMGDIDLDPATSVFGQTRVMAKNFFTSKDDGLSQKWNGRVWLNPPYSQPLIAQFAEKAVAEWKAKNITEAIILTHNYTDTIWFHLLESVAYLLCFTRGRVKFEKEDGTIAAPTQGSTFFYLGKNKQTFKDVFGKYGFIR